MQDYKPTKMRGLMRHYDNDADAINHLNKNINFRHEEGKLQ